MQIEAQLCHITRWLPFYHQHIPFFLVVIPFVLVVLFLMKVLHEMKLPINMVFLNLMDKAKTTSVRDGKVRKLGDM